MFIVFIVLLATCIGAICGMGGGVIIKPLLDATTTFTSFQISVISGCCVLTMSIASLIKHAIAHTEFHIKTAVCLSAGSIAGGFLGNFIFDKVEASASAISENYQQILKIVQNSLLSAIIIFVLIYMLFLQKRNIGLHVQNALVTVLVGLLLGALSSFLDIGGGPINVCVMCLIFGMDNKQASVNSLITIFFAQIAKLATMWANGSFGTNTLFDASFAVWTFILLLVCAVAGGLLGAVLNKKLPNKSVGNVYCGALVFVLGIAVYNIITNAIALI